MNDSSNMTYKEVGDLLGISDKSVSQFLKKHPSIKRGHAPRNGRRIGVVDRATLMVVVNRLNYTGPIKTDQIVWVN